MDQWSSPYPMSCTIHPYSGYLLTQIWTALVRLGMGGYIWSDLQGLFKRHILCHTRYLHTWVRTLVTVAFFVTSTYQDISLITLKVVLITFTFTSCPTLRNCWRVPATLLWCCAFWSLNRRYEKGSLWAEIETKYPKSMAKLWGKCVSVSFFKKQLLLYKNYKFSIGRKVTSKA